MRTITKLRSITKIVVIQNKDSGNSKLKQAHNTNRKEDWIAARTKRNDINKQIRAKKKCYILKETLSKCPKRIWSAIRKLIPGEKTMQVIQAIKTQEKEITDPLEIATTFNDYFRDWSLITGRGGATKWENRGSETFCHTPSRQG